MRKFNPRFRWHLSPAEKEIIRTLKVIGGLSQTAIAQRLHLTRNTVRKALVSMAIPTRRPIPEQEILALLREGIGQRRIGKQLGVSSRATAAVVKKYHWKRADGAGYHLAAKKRQQIIRAIENKEDHGTHLAETFSVGYHTVLDYAHRSLKCPKFLGGPTKEPFMSNFPQKYFDTLRVASMADFAEKIIDRYHKVFDGKLSGDECAEILCQSTMQGIPVLRDAPEDAKEYFRVGLFDAIRTRLADARNSQWVN